MKNNNLGLVLLAVSIFTFSLTAGSHTDYDDHGMLTDHFSKYDIKRIIENCQVSIDVTGYADDTGWFNIQDYGVISC